MFIRDMLIRIICLLSVLTMIVIAVAVYHADPLSIFLFAVFIIFYVQLPGQLILKLCKVSPKHLSSLLGTGLFTGWAFIVLQYFISQPIDTSIILYVTGPLCSLAYIVCSLRSGHDASDTTGLRKKIMERAAGISPAFCIFVVIGLLYSMLFTQYLYLSPEVDHTITMNPDKGFHMGLINSLSHGYPLECPWFSGLFFNYHIFAELLYSIPVSLFGMTADTMMFTCGPYLTVYAISISFYAFFREFSGKNRAGIYCLILILSNIYIAREITDSIAFLFIYRNDNVAGFAISAAMCLVILIRYWYDAHKDHGFALMRFIPVTAVLMLLTGIKGPFGLVIVGALWGTFVLGMILRQAHLRTVLPLIVLSIGFYLIYSVILGSKGQAVGAESSLIALGNITNITFYKAPLVALLKSMGIPSIFRYGALLLVFTIFLLTCFFLPFVLGYFRELYLVCLRKKEFDFTRVLIYAASLVGFIGIIILNYHGHSQIYFGFITVFFAPLIAFWFLEDMEENRRWYMKAVRGIFIVSLCFTTIGLAAFLHGQTGEAIEAADPDSDASKYKSITHEEYEAMRWIDKNTPKDSLLATDRYYSVDPAKFDIRDRWDNRYFLYADYSNRICYFAGAGYSMPDRDWRKRYVRIQINDLLFDPQYEKRGDLARSLGIDYLVVSKRFTSPAGLEGADYNKVYSNRDIDVLQVTE